MEVFGFLREGLYPYSGEAKGQPVEVNVYRLLYTEVVRFSAPFSLVICKLICSLGAEIVRDEQYTDLDIYLMYRDYMQKKYGPGPWCKITYPNIDPQDKFLVWRRNTFPERFGSKYAGLREVYREEVALFTRGSLKKARSEKRSRRSRGVVGKKYYPLPGTLA